jgi:hypothetical protein
MLIKKMNNWDTIGMESFFESVKHTSVNKYSIRKQKHNIIMPIALNIERLSTLFTSKLIVELKTRS